ncbi:hypothetical protein BDZ89DRAFT_1150195 [Hymenopellis radicata]|nr:hypothetical protein BDZ89DRAFT_1150195 [Hymenopellis radicata]
MANVGGQNAASSSRTTLDGLPARPRGRKRANLGLTPGSDVHGTRIQDHSLLYNEHGLVGSQPIPGVPQWNDDTPYNLDDDEDTTMDFAATTGEFGNNFSRPLSEWGTSDTVLDPTGQPYHSHNLEEERDTEEEGEGGGDESGGRKRKFYPSDDPMAEWRLFLPLFLEETLRRHGLADAPRRPQCSSCSTVLNIADDNAAVKVPDVQRPFRHQRCALHRVKIWRNGSWEATTLRDMGLVFQVGHSGAPCRHPEVVPRIMMVLHITGVHVVSYRYCNCGASDGLLKWQQLLRTVIATLNVRDFVSSLESMTDPFKTEWTPDCYNALGCVSRQWDFLMRARRSGVPLDPGGLSAAALGALIVECWACPRVGVNLPPEWETVADKYQYRYRRIVSADANFRMSNKLKPMAHPDPPLFDGLGVQMPVEMYTQWLRTYITEEEVSNCASFAALMQKNTRFTVGPRWSGILGVICAHHEIMLGLGDLQKGERYKNTDFVLYTVLSRMGLKEVTVTYDIACQYKKHFHERIDALPTALRSLDIPELTWGLPVWHSNVHDVECEAAESVKYKVGVGKTDGKGPERVWALLNPMSYRTKEQQPGHSLLRRLRIALLERKVQVEAFKAVEAGITPAQRGSWLKIVLDWLSDAKKQNPYLPPKTDAVTPSEGKIRLEFRKQEEEKARLDTATTIEEDEPEVESGGKTKKKKAPVKRTTISEMGFIIAGMRLEESKDRLRRDRGGSLTVEKQGKIYERRHTVTLRLKEFRKWQEKFMPGVQNVLEAEEESRRESYQPLPPVEDTQIYMPSAFGSLTDEEWAEICGASLFEKEAALRRGQCGDALDRLRSRLMAKRHFLNFRNANLVGQNKTTRAAKLIEALGKSIKESATKYRYCRNALRAIVGDGACGIFKELLEEDVDLPDLKEPDDDAVKELGRLGGRGGRVTGTTKKKTKKERAEEKRRNKPGETRSIMSWIWTAGGIDPDDDEYLVQCVQIEWSKALA